MLTVAVSISAGVAAIASATPDLVEHRVVIGLVFIALITMANLRGVKESGRVFAVPTYVYVVILGSLIGYGLFGFDVGDLQALPVNEEALQSSPRARTPHRGHPLRPDAGVLLGRRGPDRRRGHLERRAVFKPPESKNASRTLIAMVAILGAFFLGISVLAHHLSPPSTSDETVLSIWAARCSATACSTSSSRPPPPPS